MSAVVRGGLRPVARPHFFLSYLQPRKACMTDEYFTDLAGQRLEVEPNQTSPGLFLFRAKYA
jgi:hypothetical protein